ncbi:MAG: tRNA (N6-isopentenyl adenosine(37)-C2)-methylthiotransferase MiaB [Myxococcota bacterium]
MSDAARQPERFFVETWGCQMNELDSRRLAGQLVSQGMVPTGDPAAADWILLNSCSVREKAAQKVYSRLGEYRLLKAERPGLRIGLCGCVGQQEGEHALSRVAELDLVLGPARVGELGRLLPALRAGERVVAVGFPEERAYDLDALSRDDSPKGMVTIIEGCDNRCTFCIVPTTRGPERCRPLADVVEEVRRLLALGFEEIELLGQTVNHWREPGATGAGSDERWLDFADLLDAVAPLPGLRRLRFLTTFPRDFTQRMIDRLARHANLCDYLHLPVQSGSDRVLRRMGRGYDVASYLDLVSRVRAARPSVAVSTDLIVGFPGESEEDFQATLRLLEAVRFSALFPFRYSPRPGTAALKLLDDAVPELVAEDRLRRLNDFQNAIQAELNAELVGATKEVIVTGAGKQPGRLHGRTSCHRIVHFDGGSAPPSVGTFVDVCIMRAHSHSLAGELVGSDRAARLPVVA